MSGIFGIFSTNQSKEDCNKILQWNKIYGSSEADIFNDRKLYLGCCHEKISDFAKKNNPIITIDHKVYISDVIIYNRSELINKCNFESASSLVSDEELLANYIHIHGISALKHVNGDFSGCIYDIDNNTLTIYRDHMGVRPLFYYSDNNSLTFSTDMRGILGLSFVTTNVSEKWIYRYANGYGYENTTNTEYDNIYCLSPGSYSIWNLNNSLIEPLSEKYWIPGSSKIRLKNEKEYQNRLKELITDSITKRLSISSAKVGAELSGGLDSGVIDILINRLGRDCLYHSWSKDPDKLSLVENDERIVILDICKQEDIECHYSSQNLDLSDNSETSKRLSSLGFTLHDNKNIDFRYTFPPYVNTQFILDGAEYMKKNGVNIIFSGHGGDEGVSHRSNIYELFYNHEYYHYFRNMWRRSFRDKNRITGTLKRIKTNLFNDAPKLKSFYKDPIYGPQLLNATFSSKHSDTPRKIQVFNYNPIEYVRTGGSRNRLDNLAIQGAYCGVRYFIPYLDYRVIDFALSIPRYNYFKGSINRYIFREAFKDIMPNSLYTLRNKEDTSASSDIVEKDENWYIENKRIRENLYSHLNNDTWKSYLSEADVQNWINADKDTVDNDINDFFNSAIMIQYAKAQNVLDVVRQ